MVRHYYNSCPLNLNANHNQHKRVSRAVLPLNKIYDLPKNMQKEPQLPAKLIQNTNTWYSSL